MRSKNLFVLALPLLLAVPPLHAHEPAVTPSAAVATTAATALPPLAARYQFQVGKRNSDWYLIREANRIVIFDAASGQAKLWEKDARGEIEFSRIFTADRRLVEYAPGEVKARGPVPDWNALASIVGPRDLAGLRKIGERKLLGRNASVLTGKAAGAKLQVWWLAQERLPAMLQHGQGSKAVRLVLRELRERPAGDWNWAEPETLAA
ncbi:MAG: hypothetical protein ABIG36_02000 [Pseudomonadota bacterium]